MEIKPLEALDKLATLLVKTDLKRGIWGIVAFFLGILLRRIYPGFPGARFWELEFYAFSSAFLVGAGIILFIYAGIKEVRKPPALLDGTPERDPPNPNLGSSKGKSSTPKRR